MEISLDALAAGGDAVGRGEDGRVVFVPYGAPGERVRISLSEEHKQFARGELVEVLSASPDRTDPPCPYFRARTCGGCTWQHLVYSAQAAAKQQIVSSALRHLVAAGLELRPILTPVEPYFWRRRARLHWVRPGKKPTLVGFFAPRSRRVTHIEACPQVEPAIEAALEPIHRILGPGLFQRGEIDLLCDPAGQVQVAVRGPCRQQAAAALVGQGGIAGVILGRRVYGAAALEIEPGVWAQADRFAQASRAGNQALSAELDRVTRPREGARVLELYAGSGNLTRVLLDGAAEVVAVDARPGRPLSDPHLRWRIGPVAAVVTDLVARRADEPTSAVRFDLVVLDPPREGARAALEPVVALAPARIVYVSCDPATLARDLTVLAERGYRPLSAQPIDLMPQTAHIEVVATLERA